MKTSDQVARADRPSSDASPVSVIILVKNEEQVLERCLASVWWADEVVIVDSGSTDRSRAIAVAHGARVIDQPFLGWSAQRNIGAAAALHDWVFFLDADESVTLTLRQSIRAALAGSPSPDSGYSVDRRTEFLGKLLTNEQRRSKIISFVRLYNRQESDYDAGMVVHERVLVKGETRLLDGVLVQWRSQTLTEYTRRILRYTPLEAELLQNNGQESSVLRLGLAPIARLLWLLVVRGHFRFGTVGVLHALHKAQGDWMRYGLLWHRRMHSDAGTRLLEDSLNINEGPQARTASPGTAVLRDIWLAPARLCLLVAWSLWRRPSMPTMMSSLQAWNTRWLVAGKAWEAGHVIHRMHPAEAVLQQ